MSQIVEGRANMSKVSKKKQQGAMLREHMQYSTNSQNRMAGISVSRGHQNRWVYTSKTLRLFSGKGRSQEGSMRT